MGTSNWQNISYNIELTRKLNPKSILDIGVGFGRWGMLFREFLEIWEKGRYDGKWEIKMDGVEIYEPYIKDYHKYFYDNIYIANALDYMKETEKNYDLINCGDVIEHFTKKDGEELIKLCLTKGKYLLITIPVGKNWEQLSAGDNPFEEHKSVWYNNDFTKYKYHILKSFTDLARRDYSVVLLSREKIVFDKRFGKYFNTKNILKHKLGLKRFVERFEERERKN
jgi:predicted SAM-dependent methyltransferase